MVMLTGPEVQLKRSDKAWKPIGQQDDNKDAKTVKTDVSVLPFAASFRTVSSRRLHIAQSLYRDVKSILNNITPQTFDEMALLFVNLDQRMDTQERIQGVVNILIDKVTRTQCQR